MTVGELLDYIFEHEVPVNTEVMASQTNENLAVSREGYVGRYGSTAQINDGHLLIVSPGFETAYPFDEQGIRNALHAAVERRDGVPFVEREFEPEPMDEYDDDEDRYDNLGSTTETRPITLDNTITINASSPTVDWAALLERYRNAPDVSSQYYTSRTSRIEAAATPGSSIPNETRYRIVTDQDGIRRIEAIVDEF